MTSTSALTGIFDTRREAEMAVEHLTQHLRIPRDEIWIEPESGENTVGVEVAGSDAKRGDPAPEPDADAAALEGRIKVTLDERAADRDAILGVFRDFQASDIRDG